MTFVASPASRTRVSAGHHGPLRVGVGGPVGSGKTALVERLCKRLRDSYDIYVITNDIYTKEDQLILTRAQALPAFLQSYVSNWVTGGVRLIPLGQTDGQLAIAELEEAVLHVSAQAQDATIDDLGSAAFMVDLASMAHETQYTRLFRS